MEILLLLGLGAFAYVAWKRSRGEPVSMGRMAGGCLGVGCLGLVILFIAGVIALWLLLQAIGDLDVSISDFLETGGGDGDRGGRENGERIFN